MRYLLVVLICGLALGGEEPDARVADARARIHEDPQDYLAWMTVSDALVARGDLLRAWGVLEDAIAANPDVLRLRTELGHLLVRFADGLARNGIHEDVLASLYAAAGKRFAAAREISPDSPDAIYGMALADFRLGAYEPAAAARVEPRLAECLEIDESHPQSLALRARLLYERRQFAEAERALAAALRRDMLEVDDAVRHGHCLIALGFRDAATEAYLEALRRHPGSDAPIRNGLYFLAGRDWSKAVDLLRRATRVAPGSAVAFEYLGHALFLRRNDVEAAAAFAEAHRLDPTEPLYAHRLGETEERRGDVAAALEGYRWALEIDAGYGPSLESFDRLARSNPDIERAEALYEELLRLAPENPWIHNNYGFHLRDWAERSRTGLLPDPPPETVRRLVRAIEVYEIAARLAPDSPQLQSDTGLALEFYPATRDDSRARAYFCRAVELCDGLYRDALEGLMRIDARAGDRLALRSRARHVIDALERGERAVAPSGEGPPADLPPTAREMFLRRAKAALAHALHE